MKPKRKLYGIYYMGEGRVIDKIEARFPKEALDAIIRPEFFMAKEIKAKK